MASDPRIRQLLEDVLDSGRTPEDVCQACPELLSEVREGLRELTEVEAAVDALYSETGPTQMAANKAASGVEIRPRIPGYEIQEVLGRGGVGVVYMAHHLRLHRTVALKMLLSGAHARAEERERFLREAEAIAGIHHPNIVQVHDVGDHDGRQFFTMEFVEGGSLAQKLNGTPQPSQQAANMVAMLADAMQAAHHARIVHRDLKPANVLLTADGIPKITDFGLAKLLEGKPGLTKSGDAMGTPSYMAPEQAQGKARALGTAVDIYALGAILYEMLTGRPPFRAESSAETIQQVIHQDPVAPSRLNPKVPRDLETICLKCLDKDPLRRYASAAALVDDLQRFQRCEPISARPPRVPERASKWVRRRPAQATLIAVGLLLMIGAIGVAFWWTLDRRALARAVEDDLREARVAQRRLAWTEAGTALERARGRMGNRGTPALQSQLEQCMGDQQLVARLDDIRTKRATSLIGRASIGQSDRDYEMVFSAAGFGKPFDDARAVGNRIKESNIRDSLVDAMDDWCSCVDRVRENWLRKVLFEADPDQKGWRGRMCDPNLAIDAAMAKELAEAAYESKASMSALQSLGQIWAGRTREDGYAFLRRVQSEHPGNFWGNIFLGNMLHSRKSPPDANDLLEAIGYYRAANSSRPGALAAIASLGIALAESGNDAAALDQWREAALANPAAVIWRRNMGICLLRMGRAPEALADFEKAIALDADDCWTHHYLGQALLALQRPKEALAQSEQAIRLETLSRGELIENFAKSEFRQAQGESLLALGRDAEAREQFQQAVVLNRKCSAAHFRLVKFNLREGRTKEALEHWQLALAFTFAQFEQWDGYAELCLYLGNESEYCRACAAMIARYGAKPDPRDAERMARACFLLPQSAAAKLPDETSQRANALLDFAIADATKKHEWTLPYFQVAKSLAEYRQGHFENAQTLLSGEPSKVLPPLPDLILAMTYHRLGKKNEALQALALAKSKFDWSASKAVDREAWMYHILRREAEAMIQPAPDNDAAEKNEK